MPTAANSSVDPVAVVGAVTGVAAFAWNIYRSIREGERLDLSFYAYREIRPGRDISRIGVDVTNTGTTPAFITSVEVVRDLPWQDRVLVLRSRSFRTRSRWWAHWLYRTAGANSWNVRLDNQLIGRLEAGEARHASLVDIINGEPEPMDATKVAEIVDQRRWAVVDTGRRHYSVRIVDNRPRDVNLLELRRAGTGEEPHAEQ